MKYIQTTKKEARKFKELEYNNIFKFLYDIIQELDLELREEIFSKQVLLIEDVEVKAGSIRGTIYKFKVNNASKELGKALENYHVVAKS